MRLAIGLASVVVPILACAHAADAWNLHAWNLDPLVTVPLLVVLALYLRSFARLAHGQRIAFAAGLAVLLAALVSPLDSVAEESLSAHMAQHALLIALAPPLLLVGNPAQIFAWGGARFSLRLALIFAALSRPAPATFLHGLALWLWHAPLAFQAAARSYPVHILQHVAFLLTALLFWRAILGARTAPRTAAALAAAFITLLHSGLLGALITLAPYPLYGGASLEDQQLAGLIMWVPMGLAYLAACLFLARRLLMEHSIT